MIRRHGYYAEGEAAADGVVSASNGSGVLPSGGEWPFPFAIGIDGTTGEIAVSGLTALSRFGPAQRIYPSTHPAPGRFGVTGFEAGAGGILEEPGNGVDPLVGGRSLRLEHGWQFGVPLCLAPHFDLGVLPGMTAIAGIIRTFFDGGGPFDALGDAGNAGLGVTVADLGAGPTPDADLDLVVGGVHIARLAGMRRRWIYMDWRLLPGITPRLEITVLDEGTGIRVGRWSLTTGLPALPVGPGIIARQAGAVGECGFEMGTLRGGMGPI